MRSSIDVNECASLSSKSIIAAVGSAQIKSDTFTLCIPIPAAMQYVLTRSDVRWNTWAARRSWIGFVFSLVDSITKHLEPLP